MIIILPIYLVCILIFFTGSQTASLVAAGGTTLFFILSMITEKIYPHHMTRDQMLGTAGHDSVAKTIAKGAYGYLNFFAIWTTIIALIAGVISIFR